ncbi:hypothetical protein DL546_003888 [Coniochaeta pulveracea]|uniref:Uncharacterized protein n=1 Tax=Coniochaeta pulveracea TaxID=177199 RepID=A0A420Y616_9PEZI|nr:hypothetical protein DL546_003888 [Coniochaeta pulveracea]
MLPPVEDAILDNNPRFAELSKRLTTAVLNSNGSTKNDPKAKGRAEVKEQLNSRRLTHLKRTLLLSALSTANPSESAPKPSLRRPRVASTSSTQTAPQPPPTTSSLPPDLLDLLTLLPPLLSSETSLDTKTFTLLLSKPPFTSLPDLLPQLSASVSAALISRATLLSRILNTTTNPSFLHRTISSLPTQASSLLTTLSEKKAALVQARADTTRALIQLLQINTAVLSALVRSLEAKHGNIARSLELRAAEVSVNAMRQEAEVGKMLGQVKEAVYTLETRRALERYAEHLRDAKYRVDEGGRGDEGKERVMREMARVYREMGKQMEEVRGDLERLGRA